MSSLEIAVGIFILIAPVLGFVIGLSTGYLWWRAE